MKISPDDWKRTLAVLIVYGYGYTLVFWPLAFWITTMLTLFTDHQFPAPPIIPWEQLGAATVTLGTVGGLEKWGERVRKSSD